MRLEVVGREPQDTLELLQFEFVSAQLGRVIRRLVVVAQQVFIVGAALRQRSL